MCLLGIFIDSPLQPEGHHVFSDTWSSKSSTTSDRRRKSEDMHRRSTARNIKGEVEVIILTVFLRCHRLRNVPAGWERIRKMARQPWKARKRHKSDLSTLSAVSV